MTSPAGLTWSQVKAGLARAERELADSKWWQLGRRRRAERKVRGFIILMQVFERIKLDREGS